jgi:hypothetical protein
MEPSVVVAALLGMAALALFLARRNQSEPETEAIPVRVDDEPQPR